MKIEIKPQEKDGYSDHEVTCALDTLMEAERIKGDLKLMALVQKEIKSKQRAIKSIQDIKDRFVEVVTRVPETDLIDGEAKAEARTIKDEEEEGEDE